MLRLHDYVLSPEAYGVRLMLALLGRSYEVVAVDAYPGGGDVPVFEDGETVLRDPGLILTHLARSDRSGLWLPAEHAPEIAGWLAFAALELSALSTARKISAFGGAGDLAALQRQGRAALRRVDDHLTDRRLAGFDWLVGDRASIADISIFPAVMLSHDAGIGHEDFAAINLWQRRLRRLPGFIGMPGIPDYF